MGDKHGNCVYLNERECSIQRRNQKVIEEAPSSFLDAETRAAMGAQAVMLARAVDYDSAGTVEFLVDHERNFYFLEMNTRLQVEHPITECITGVDLVELMIHSAANEPLPIKQSDIGIKGWAMEARVYAEDSELFLPSIGRLTSYQEPPSGVRDPFVRCDTGIVEGSEISMFYDPMICKLIASSDHDDPSTARDEARERLCAALDAYVIQGVTHNIPLLRDILTNEAFARGDLSTNFLPEEYPHGFKGRQLDDEGEAELIAGATAMRLQQIMTAISFSDNQRVPEDYHVRTVSADSDEEVMSAMDNKVMFENSAEEIASLPARLVVDIKGGDGRTRSHAVAVESLTGDEVNLRVAQLDGGDDSDAQGYQTKSMTVSLPRLRHAALLEFDVGAERPLLIEKVGENGVATLLRHQGSLFEVSVLTQQESRLLNALPVRVAPDTSHEVVSPMPGTVVSVASLQPGDVVVKGQEVAVIEAMKMQNSLRAARSGVVKRVYAAQGDTLAADQLIIEFEKE
jgi:propionyl-CoA carboxylase alpha chain